MKLFSFFVSLVALLVAILTAAFSPYNLDSAAQDEDSGDRGHAQIPSGDLKRRVYLDV